MASLQYGAENDPGHIEDRALAHLKVVIATKLRRNESFTLSWRHADGDPVGRSTIWIHPRSRRIHALQIHAPRWLAIA